MARASVEVGDERDEVDVDMGSVPLDPVERKESESGPGVEVREGDE